VNIRSQTLWTASYTCAHSNTMSLYTLAGFIVEQKFLWKEYHFCLMFNRPVFSEIAPGHAWFPAGLPNEISRELVWSFTGWMLSYHPTDSVKALKEHCSITTRCIHFTSNAIICKVNSEYNGQNGRMSEWLRLNHSNVAIIGSSSSLYWVPISGADSFTFSWKGP